MDLSEIKYKFYPSNRSRSDLTIVFFIFVALALLHFRQSAKVKKIFIEYGFKERTNKVDYISDAYKYSIVIISFNRTKCLERAFNRIYYEEKLTNDTEILVVDDNTTEIMHKEYLVNISKLPKVTVIINLGYHGAFYNKLHGYYMERGKYILACDDDDIADVGYYRELIDHIEDRYDIIYQLLL